ncbi:GNAT family N-acetyltransferase [Schumannella sp. 10F1B-5-1]|uniref:GNAT family N-acetyltransferase n=1 Tax=Schumannella sp. 10F1B-5-1 TaxID=2590780 RepID=UPI00113092C2|nr:GNAT family N-acetyltransferase [Schumannella sp. 10F1B-5-1]TPW70149.1 GNAT family N-acetyltransferase [Schumannella sp. 10F1B-5-1]
MSASGLTIRPITPDDLAAWRELFRAYGEFYETAFDDAQLDHVGALLVAEGSGIDALVAVEGSGDDSAEVSADGSGEADAVIGFAHYRSFPDTFSTRRDWFLDDLFVDPAARGNGAATALIERLGELARDGAEPGQGGTLRWITAASNERAQRVYDRIAQRTTWVTYEVRL